ncbi:MAG: hypothetical protein KME60_13580 [Cyanomargarita calcarea GSE-NOS-MK-12-04C]|jgi:hypothetical protein|uniref:Uncharacterized protein n=1 Tax=Cyanomargarita calcarea GSE-NOS-MK-12-04C TaxID=2839659 RepID=A0A951QM00_9CYAN|nr:hypothetical protein [Cyanomargarita calcarea GSE-NOS-MK-12-04C]
MTLSRNTEQVISAKINLVKAFTEAKKRLVNQVLVQPISEIPLLPTPTMDEIAQLIDLTLGQAGLEPKLLAGVKLNAIAFTNESLPDVAALKNYHFQWKPADIAQ